MWCNMLAGKEVYQPIRKAHIVTWRGGHACNLGQGRLSPILSLLCYIVIYGKCLLCSKQPNKMNDITNKASLFLSFFAIKLLLIKHIGLVPAPWWPRLRPFEQYWLEIQFLESLNSQKIGLKLHHTCQFMPSFPNSSRVIRVTGSQSSEGAQHWLSGWIDSLSLEERVFVHLWEKASSNAGDCIPVFTLWLKIPLPLC